MAEPFGDKTHEATPHRRQQARERGHVVKSQDLGSAGLLLLGMGALLLVGGSIVRYLLVLLAEYLGGPAWLGLDRDGAVSQSYSLMTGAASAVLPLLGLLLAIAVLISVIQ